MEPVCKRVKYAKAKRDIRLDGSLSPTWTEWHRGGLKQVVRPHVWYFVLHNCGSDSIKEKARIKFEFEAVQHDGSHFSAENEGMIFVHGIKLAIFGLYSYYFW